MDSTQLARIRALCAQYAEWRYRQKYDIGGSVDNSYKPSVELPVLDYIKKLVHTFTDATGATKNVFAYLSCKKMISTNQGGPSGLQVDDHIPRDFVIVHQVVNALEVDRPKFYRVFEIEYMDLPARFIGTGRIKAQYELANKFGLSNRTYRRYRQIIHEEILMAEEIEALEAPLLEPYVPDMVDLQLREEFKKL